MRARDRATLNLLVPNQRESSLQQRLCIRVTSLANRFWPTWTAVSRSDPEDVYEETRPSLDLGLEAIREAIRTTAPDDESADAVWQRLQASESSTAL